MITKQLHTPILYFFVTISTAQWTLTILKNLILQESSLQVFLDFTKISSLWKSLENTHLGKLVRLSSPENLKFLNYGKRILAKLTWVVYFNNICMSNRNFFYFCQLRTLVFNPIGKYGNRLNFFQKKLFYLILAKYLKYVSL